jgi:hypothetical protein
MRTAAVLRQFGSRRAVADALQITVQAVYQWGPLVPPLQAARLAGMPGTGLIFDPAEYSAWNGRTRKSRSRRKAS